MELKKVLIISPYFPPSNAADMQRIRMSLPYFKDYGWDAEIVTVDPQFSEIVKDDLLLFSVPKGIKTHLVKALSKKWTSKFGLGSLAIRSLWFYKKIVNRLLAKNKYDLIYFSTTQFPVCILGAYWKKRFGIPYVIDMQDPWHSDYYRNKPKNERPAKYWFSYRLNKYLEPIAMKRVSGLISVSESYITDLKSRYPEIKNIPAVTIPFGALQVDFEIAAVNQGTFKTLLEPPFTNIVYIGRGGTDMNEAVKTLFSALKSNLGILDKIKLYFIGTSYAPSGQGKASILPIAKQFGIEEMVIEITDRISYYHALATLQSADALFIPGSNDPKYSASKIYPYLLTQKPLLAIFNSRSPALKILQDAGAPNAYSYDDTVDIESKINKFLEQLVERNLGIQEYASSSLQQYAAENMTKLQCELFEKTLLYYMNE